MEQLRYVPFSSQIDLNFWHKLCDKKLDELKLSEDSVAFNAEYSNNLTVSHSLASVGYGAFTETPRLCLRGRLFNKNSIDSFKQCDKMLLLKTVMNELIEKIKTGEAIETPEVLNQMILLSFADLKKYHFYYWCSFPSLSIPDSQFQNKPQPLENLFTADRLRTLAERFEGRQYLLLDKSTLERVPFNEIKTNDDFFVVFADPSSAQETVGWPLRNLLLLIAYHMAAKTAEYEVIAVRGSKIDNFNKSLHLKVKLNKITFDEQITYVGWERNEKGQNGPRFLNLSSSMDPTALAESAVDLNLKLMRWRLAPELNLEKISSAKCLLLGAGTLGCNVARCLIGWGVRNLTFVDNGKVSYSNPVRQSLFTFDDSLKGGRPKAQAAAESIKRIFPGITASYVELSIPMPGHTVSESNADHVKQTVDELERLIEHHDVVFLLLDTREARWLPTLLGKKHQKIVMNAALGFDSFLVMRHGTIKNTLGCYFCNDVVAPTNSTKDRTLDQQCTVSRPGISFMAASFAVEMLTALLQHNDGIDAKADNPCNEEVDSKNVLGSIPHQLRCFLRNYHFMTPSTEAFSMCTACSPRVIDEYSANGFDFLMKVFNEEEYLEGITGIAELHRMTEEIDIIALDDSDNELSQ